MEARYRQPGVGRLRARAAFLAEAIARRAQPVTDEIMEPDIDAVTTDLPYPRDGRRRAALPVGSALSAQGMKQTPIPEQSTGDLTEASDIRGRPPVPDLMVRMGFGVDVVAFSRRTIPAQIAVQKRVRRLVAAVLGDLGLSLSDIRYQVNGDGMHVFLPPTTQLHRTLAPLLHGMAANLAKDNTGSGDRIRLRMATVFGPVGWEDLGFSGNTVIECGRLLDSPMLRTAVLDNQHCDLVAFVSDYLYRHVVFAGFPGLDTRQFHRVQVENKEFDEPAWLWVGPTS